MCSRFRDEIEMLPIASRAGNDRNASPGGLDFMDGGMTRRMKAHVSTILTESGLSISLRVRHFKGSERENRRCKPTSTAWTGVFGLTRVGTLTAVGAPEAMGPRGGGVVFTV